MKSVVIVAALVSGMVAPQPPVLVTRPPQATAPARAPLGPGEGRAVVQRLAEELEAGFVLPEVGARYAAMLRTNLASGRYDRPGERAQLARRLTDDLQAVATDGHLRVMVNGEPDQSPAGQVARLRPPAIQSARWLAGGIAYLRLTEFSSSPGQVSALRRFMSDHRDARTIIFDLRNHRGGAMAEMDVIFSYLFAKRTPLVRLEMLRAIHDRKGGWPFDLAPTLELRTGSKLATATHYAVPGPETPLRNARVILLTSNVTGSAGEHFALAFKTTGRGILIGEATAGANHFGGPAPIGDHFQVWLPIGRTVDVKTGLDWEGIGVAPDIPADPRQGLILALERGGLSRTEAERINAGEIPADPVHREPRAH